MKRMILVATLVVLASALVRGAGDEPGDLFKQGTDLVGQGKYAEAGDVLKKEVDAHPSNTKAWMFLATAHERINQWKEAAAAWDKFVRLTDSVDEKSFGEKRAKDCRDRASGKVADDTAKPTPGPGPTPTPTPADTTEDYTKFETQQPVFYAPVKTPHFIIMAKNKDLLDATVADAERHIKRIINVFLFGREWSHTITIRIFKDQAEYCKEAGMPTWSGGGYSMRSDGAGGSLLGIDLFALDAKGSYAPDLLKKILPHELTHAVIHESFGDRAWGSLPRAINEGLAMYSEEGTETFYERELCEAVKRNNIYKLGDLFRMPNYPPNVGLFYAESASATRYLIEHMKAAEFETFMGELKKGNNVNSALQTAKMATGDLIAAVETNWLEMLKEKGDYYAKHPLPKESKKPKDTKVAKTDGPKKGPADPTKTEPYDPSKNEKKKPGDEDDEKDTIIEVK